jgi:hypothetical protein
VFCGALLIASQVPPRSTASRTDFLLRTLLALDGDDVREGQTDV